MQHYCTFSALFGTSLRYMAGERKPLPREPQVGHQEGAGTQDVLDAQNDAAMQAFNEDALDTCQHCGRSFLVDRWAGSLIGWGTHCQDTLRCIMIHDDAYLHNGANVEFPPLSMNREC